MRGEAGEREPHVPLGRDGEGRLLFAPVGTLVVTDGGACLVCHTCGAQLASISAAHLTRHGLTQTEYRARYRLAKRTSLVSPVLAQTRREEGHRRWASNQGVRDGLAIGQAKMADGTLLAMQHAAVRAAGGQQALPRNHPATDASRARRAQEAERARQARLRELGFPDEAAYLRDRYVTRQQSIQAIGKEWHTHTSVVGDRLRTHGIPVRPRAGGVERRPAIEPAARR